MIQLLVNANMSCLIYRSCTPLLRTACSFVTAPGRFLWGRNRTGEQPGRAEHLDEHENASEGARTLVPPPLGRYRRRGPRLAAPRNASRAAPAWAQRHLPGENHEAIHR